MKIEELDDVDSSRGQWNYESQIVRVDAKRALVGAGARILFYPTLLYNVLRNKMEPEFRWWDEVNEVLLLLLSLFRLSICVVVIARIISCYGYYIHGVFAKRCLKAPFNCFVS